MKGLLTGINAVVTGHTVYRMDDQHFQGMRFTPKGKAVMNVKVGCNSGQNKPATFIILELWGACAEKVNELYDKGKAVIAEGVVFENNNKSDNGRYYHELKLIYISKLQFEVDGEFMDIPLNREEEKEEDESVAGGEKVEKKDKEKEPVHS